VTTETTRSPSQASVPAAEPHWAPGGVHHTHADRGLVRRLAGHAAQHDALRFGWQLVPVGGGAAVATGLEFLQRDDDGLIRTAYSFIDPSA
jgi:hypothetical protein